MRKGLMLALFLLTLLPAFFDNGGFSASAQNFAYENGSYWIPGIEVTGNDKSKVKCDCCQNNFNDQDTFDRHLQYDYVCRSYYGLDNDDNNNGDNNNDNNNGGNKNGNNYNGDNSNNFGFGGQDFCPFCMRSYDYCNCQGVIVSGNSSPSNPWIIIVPNTPPKDDNLYNSDSIETEDETAPSDTSQQKQLNALIDRIFANISKSAYPNLSKDKYIARLKELIDNSLKIQQGNNGTCGSAVVCKWMLENNPELFINMAAGIYENGAYEINGVYLGVPTGHLWSSWLGEKSWLEVSDADITSMTNSHSVDVIMQGTITNWMNYALNYNPFEGNSDFTSMAFPNRICDFLKEFLGVSTNIISNFPSQLTYSDVKDLDFKSNFVIALVGKIQGNSFNEYIPEHYVQACSIEKNNDGYSLDYWTWGESKNRTSIVDNSQSGIFGLIIVKPQIRK